MTSRWDLERAVLASELPAPARLLLLVLLIRADARTLDTGKYSPSLTKLADDTGLGRSTVARELDRLERAGWIERHRPPVDLARSKKARTRYVVRDPAAPSPRAGLVPERDQASPSVGPDWSQSGTSSSPRAGHRSDQSDQSQISSQVTTRIADLIEELSGQRVSDAYAAAVARRIGPGKSNTLAYVEKCIRNDPARFVPTPQPPRFTAANGFES